jgi:hypothetical protein
VALLKAILINLWGLFSGIVSACHEIESRQGIGVALKKKKKVCGQVDPDSVF